jgi:hypothetical protein
MRSRGRSSRLRGRIFTNADGKIRPRVKSCRRVECGRVWTSGRKGRRTVNFTVGRPFRHP